ncbi:MAG: hypothetical protein JOZ78_17425 [Chroococcidiopsidaceae cyanobacterium CP_BM_ER_R8_30]|nr:hypothetical protein [Chroococcidiopsidaceae cyanobacterium CP_BM_ER_R8_30]
MSAQIFMPLALFAQGNSSNSQTQVQGTWLLQSESGKGRLVFTNNQGHLRGVYITPSGTSIPLKGIHIEPPHPEPTNPVDQTKGDPYSNLSFILEIPPKPINCNFDLTGMTKLYGACSYVDHPYTKVPDAEATLEKVGN